MRKKLLFISLFAVIIFCVFYFLVYRFRSNENTSYGNNEYDSSIIEDEIEENEAFSNETLDNYSESSLAVNDGTKDNPVSDEVDYDETIFSLTGEYVEPHNIDWNELKEENDDVYAWLYVPNTSIDYPVLQSELSNDYYLSHNLDGSEGYPGCLYTEYLYNSKTFSDFNTVIYGHNMKNGTMFATLHRFADSDFFNNNRYLYIYTPDKTFIYEIFAAYKSDNSHILSEYTNDNKTLFKEYINNILSLTGDDVLYNEEACAKVSVNSHILTLETCIQTDRDSRWVVQGVLLNED